jgi:hypothetical protein
MSMAMGGVVNPSDAEGPPGSGLATPARPAPARGTAARRPASSGGRFGRRVVHSNGELSAHLLPQEVVAGEVNDGGAVHHGGGRSKLSGGNSYRGSDSRRGGQ